MAVTPLWNHDALIEELTAHGVAREIIEEMWTTGISIPTAYIPELMRLVDQGVTANELRIRGRSYGSTRGNALWFVEKTAIQRLLRFMKRERILVAVWCGRDASSKKKTPNRKVAVVLSALSEAGPDCVQTVVARQALYGKKTGLTETEEKQMQSVLTLVRRFLSR